MFAAAKRSSTGKSKEEAQREKKEELEKRLQDVGAVLSGKKTAAGPSKGAKGTFLWPSDVRTCLTCC